MPLLAYFVGVGTVLVGLLFVAEAQLGPAKPLSVASNFYGLPAPYKAPPTPVLTVRDAPAPEISQAMAAATPAAHGQAPLKIHVTKMPTPKKKVVRAPTNPNRNLFAATGASNMHRVC